MSRSPSRATARSAAAGWRRHLWLAYLVGSLLAGALHATGTATDWHLYEIVSVGSAVALLGGRALWHPPSSRAWALAAAGVACWAVADIVWNVLDALGGAPFPSVADGLYVLGYVLLLLAARGVASGEVRDRDAALDAAIVLAGAAGLIGMKLVDAAGSTEGSLLAKATAIAYPALSLFLVGAGARLWLSFRSRRPTIALLCAAFTLQLLADAVYAVQSVGGTYLGGVVDLGWMTAYSLLGAAALHPSVADQPRLRRAERDALSLGRLALLATSALCPLAGHVLFDLPVSIAIAATVAITMACVLRVATPVEAMRRAVSIDDLTGLRNRAAALDLIDDLLDRGDEVGLLSCDIDRFALVNDALGHAAGDALLRAVADRIVATVGDEGVVARTTTAILVVLPRGCADDVHHMAGRIQSAVSNPIAVSEVETRSTVSIGIAVADGHRDGSDLLRCADAALARAKRSGRGQVYEADGDEVNAYWRLRLAADLRTGLGRGEVTAAFQPEVDLGTGGLFGFEALARWTHPTLGEVQPDVFIPLAEESGLVSDVFRVVFEAALATQHLWLESLGASVAVAINVSPAQLSAGLVEEVRAALVRWQPDPQDVWLEVTESIVADDPNAVEVLASLQGLGVRLAIDDFGTGHSSVARLASVEWDAIKIDRSFVSRMLVDDRAHDVTAATIAMARSLGALTVAEGVETAAQRDELVRLGCDVSQGFLVSRPLTLSAATDVVRADAARTPIEIRS